MKRTGIGGMVLSIPAAWPPSATHRLNSGMEEFPHYSMSAFCGLADRISLKPEFRNAGIPLLLLSGIPAFRFLLVEGPQGPLKHLARMDLVGMCPVV